MGFSKESGLFLTAKVGTLALPQLVKVLKIIRGKDSMFENNELPVELEFGRDLNYHSIFICPVTREISTRENPPSVLGCGHVLAK